MYSFTDQFISDEKNMEYLKAAMMGPNAMRISEEMASYLPIEKDKRILDLGCGCGLSTLLLTEKYSATVFAADLWVSPTDNYERFKQLGIDGKAIPVFADATKGLPFAHGYFDILFTVDAYHYFGNNTEMLPSLIPYVKKGGYIAVAVPGWKNGVKGIPEELQPFVFEDWYFYTLDWWKGLWAKSMWGASGRNNSDKIEITETREMDCCKQAWDEWLTSPNPYAAEDIELMEVENGKYFSMIQLIARVV